MKLIIEDQHGSSKIIEDTKFIPRVGELVDWDYYPTPIVKQVRYDFDTNSVRVAIS